MTSLTTKEQANEALKIITAVHGTQSYFLNAEVVFNDGFFGVDMKVEGPKWRNVKERPYTPPQINRVPICVMVYG